MDYIKVQSSNIESVAHNGTDTMYVRFKARKGRPAVCYKYSPVMVKTMEAMIAADSVGEYFIANIRGNTNLTTEKVE